MLTWCKYDNGFRRSSFLFILITILSFSTTTNALITKPSRSFHVFDHRLSNEIKSSSSLHISTEASVVLGDYAPAAESLFNNMKLPAAVVTAGMISLGFATSFPKLPKDTLERVYSKETRARCASLERLHIVVALISVTSELIVVLWSAVEVNQLTERAYEPTYSVWDLIQRDADLAWSAVNSHFVLGIIGFVVMLWLRAYVMLLAVQASRPLMVAASSGTTAALCLMISIVNRGVQSGGGQGVGYGKSIIDLVVHYISLLFQFATNLDNPGPLQVSAIGLETTSLCCMFYILLTESDMSKPQPVNEEDSCPLVDLDDEDFNMENLTVKEREKLETCLELQQEEKERQELIQKLTGGEEDDDEENREDSDSDNSVTTIIS